MASADPIYDRIGVGYAKARRADPRVAEQIKAALGDASTVLNVGAGTGNYEPTDRQVTALEPSSEMIRQRTSTNPVLQAQAEAIPARDHAFDAVMGMLTVHHWHDRTAGLRECKRVAHRQVLVVYDQEVTSQFWLNNYFTAVRTALWELDAPSAADLGEVLDVTNVEPLWVPADCTDGFTGAFWNRPEAYLDPNVQAGMSTIARLSEAERAAGTAALSAALESGEWERRHGHLREQSRTDIGYRLVTSGV